MFERTLEAARVKALETEPFWALIAMKLEIILSEEVPTAATDGTHFWINESYGTSLSREILQSLVLHEVAHVALGHQYRRGERDRKLWNFACDYVINLILHDAKHPIGPDWLLDEKFRDWSEERIYSHLVDNPPSGGPSQEPPGEVRDATHEDGSAMTEPEKDEALDEVRETLQQAEHAAKDSGDTGGASETAAIERLTRPRIQWRKFLSRWIRDKGKPIGRSWNRLDRRALSLRQYVPAEIKEGLDWLVIAVDISGSIAQGELVAFISHLEALRKQLPIQKITLLPFNQEIQRDQIEHLSPRNKLPTQLRTGGGTRFSPIFDWLRSEGRKPDAVIVFTDLWCGDYGDAPMVPVLWASSEAITSGSRSNRPPFGEAIHIDIHGGM